MNSKRYNFKHSFEIKDESFTIQFEKELGPVVIRHFDFIKKIVSYSLQPAKNHHSYPNRHGLQL